MRSLTEEEKGERCDGGRKFLSLTHSNELFRETQFKKSWIVRST